MVKSKAEILLEKYNKKECTPEEKAIVETWFLKATDNLKDLLPEPDYDTLKQEIWNQILIKNKKTFFKLIWPRVVTAAAILIFISVGGYFILRNPATQQIAIDQKHDIAPGSNQATLTLANGQKIIIRKGLNGNLAQQANAIIDIKDSNSIAYTKTPVTNPENVTVEYNTLSTSRGEQSPYPLILADGTKVWLNAASSITFPTAFNGRFRKVTVTGEVYFEVVHDVKKPFSVEVNGQTIEDVGTSFNINAYKDEPTIKTTLINGSIKLIRGANEGVLLPGQQGITQQNDDKIKIEQVNIEPITAWKDGFFRFDKVDLPTIMRQFSRWYDIQVVYDGQIHENVFVGKITRNSNLSKVLNILALSGIHYKLEGKKLIIQP